MKVLVTGGGGVIGSALIAELRVQNHIPYCVDNDITFDKTEAEEAWCQDITATGWIMRLLHKLNPDVVIHLAEISSVDPLMQVSAFKVNVGATAEVLYACTKLNIRCVVGTWGVLDPCTPLVTSIEFRRQLVDIHQSSNTVINEIQIPLIIHPDLPSSNFRSYVNRVYNFVQLGQLFVLNKQEEKDLIGSFDFNAPSYVAKRIVEYMQIRTRRSIDLGDIPIPNRATIHQIIGLALDVFDTESITIYGKEEPKQVFSISPTFEWKNSYVLHQMIEESWDAYL